MQMKVLGRDVSSALSADRLRKSKVMRAARKLCSTTTKDANASDAEFPV